MRVQKLIDPDHEILRNLHNHRMRIRNITSRKKALIRHAISKKKNLPIESLILNLGSKNTWHSAVRANLKIRLKFH